MAATSLAGSLFLSYVRIVNPWWGGRGPAVVAFAPYALIGYLVAFGAFLVLLRRSGRPRATAVGLVLATIGLATQMFWLLPSYAGKAPAGPSDVTVITLNMRFGHADAEQAVGLAVRNRADVLVLQEVTPEGYQDLIAAGARSHLRYKGGAVEGGARGTLVLSRFPVRYVHRLPITNGAFQMTIDGEHRFTLIAVHTMQPLYDPPLWRSDLRRLRGIAESVDGPVVMAGDFNASLDHEQIRDLLSAGLADAAQQAKAGWQPTWPADRSVEHGLPGDISLITLDHVFVGGGIEATSATTSLIEGTDHRALVVRLRMP